MCQLRSVLLFLDLYQVFSYSTVMFCIYHFLSQPCITVYSSFCISHAWSIITVSHLDVSIFNLTVFTLHLFTVTSGLKSIHFNFLNVNVYIFSIPICSLKY